jgi:hypothetical protein
VNVTKQSVVTPPPELPVDPFEIERAVEQLVREAFGEATGSPSQRLRQAIDAELDAGDESNRARLWVDPLDYPPGPLRDVASLYALLEQVGNGIAQGTREELAERLTHDLGRLGAYRAARRALTAAERLQRSGAAKAARAGVTPSQVASYKADFVRRNQSDRGWLKACALEFGVSEDTVNRRLAAYKAGSTA